MPILDQYGRPFPAEALARPVATPTVIGMRPAVVHTPIVGLNPASLGALMAAADSGNSQAWQELAAEIERRDLHYLGVLGTRKRSVAQLPMTVSNKDESKRGNKIADWVRDWIDTDVLRAALFDLLDGIGKGWSVLEIEWAIEPGNNRPQRLIYRPQRWFEPDYQDGDRILMRSDYGAGETPGIDGAPALPGLVEIQPEKFVVHRHPSWSGLTIQSGLTRAVAWAVMFKMFTLRDWSVFVQNYGLPMRVGRYGPESSPEDRDVLWQAVTDIAGSCAAIMPKGMEVDFIEPKNGAGANDLHQRRVDWLDQQISKAVLGQTGTADSRQGAHASGAIHRLVQEDIERADAMLLAATLNEQVIRRMVDFSFGPQKIYPRLSIGRPDEPDLAIVIGAVQNLGPQGFKVRAQDLYDKLSLNPPDDGDEIVGIIAQVQPVTSPEDKEAQIDPPADHAARAPASTDRQPAARDQQALHEPGDDVAMHARIGRLLHLHVREEGPHIVELMTRRLARDASRGLGRMTDAVRAAVESADSIADLETRLKRLDLPGDAFADAMAQGIAIAQMAGQASALEQLGRGG